MVDGKVQVQMFNYVKTLADLPKDIDGKANTPAADHLFQVNKIPWHWMRQLAQCSMGNQRATIDPGNR